MFMPSFPFPFPFPPPMKGGRQPSQGFPFPPLPFPPLGCGGPFEQPDAEDAFDGPQKKERPFDFSSGPAKELLAALFDASRIDHFFEE